MLCAISGQRTYVYYGIIKLDLQVKFSNILVNCLLWKTTDKSRRKTCLWSHSVKGVWEVAAKNLSKKLRRNTCLGNRNQRNYGSRSQIRRNPDKGQGTDCPGLKSRITITDSEKSRSETLTPGVATAIICVTLIALQNLL